MIKYIRNILLLAVIIYSILFSQTNQYSTYYSPGVKLCCKRPYSYSIDTKLIGKWKLDYRHRHGCMPYTTKRHIDDIEYNVNKYIVFTDTNISWPIKISHPLHSSINDSGVSRDGNWYVDNKKLFTCTNRIVDSNKYPKDTINKWFSVNYRIINDTLYLQENDTCQSKYIKASK